MELNDEVYSIEEAQKRIEVLENQELDSPHGQMSAESYAELLGLYLLANDLINANILWKRIPSEVKTVNVELKAIWEVGKAAWKHDYAGIHASINAYEWSDTIKQIMSEYKGKTRTHCFDLVAAGYTSIKLNYLATILGLTESETIEQVQKKNWTYSDGNFIIKPVKLKKETVNSLKNEDHLEKLTQHILFLET